MNNKKRKNENYLLMRPRTAAVVGLGVFLARLHIGRRARRHARVHQQRAAVEQEDANHEGDILLRIHHRQAVEREIGNGEKLTFPGDFSQRHYTQSGLCEKGVIG